MEMYLAFAAGATLILGLMLMAVSGVQSESKGERTYHLGLAVFWTSLAVVILAFINWVS